MSDGHRSSPSPSDDTFLAGAGEMGLLVRSIDWGVTPLGALAEWPQSLRTTMSICLNSRFPIAVILAELRVALPGARTADPEIRQRDEQFEVLYTELAAGAGAGTSAGIALEIADSVLKADAASTGEQGR